MQPTSIPLREDRKHTQGQNRNIKIALAGGVREFPAESPVQRRLKQSAASVRLWVDEVWTSIWTSIKKSRKAVYGTGFAAALLVVILTSTPHLRLLLWPAIVWGPLILAVIIAVGVIVNILGAMLSMYVGYSAGREFGSTAATLDDLGANTLGSPSDTGGELGELIRAEGKLSKFEDSLIFQSLTDEQKSRYYRAHQEVLSLIREISNEAFRQTAA
jgi:hypothetical protein